MQSEVLASMTVAATPVPGRDALRPADRAQLTEPTLRALLLHPETEAAFGELAPLPPPSPEGDNDGKTSKEVVPTINQLRAAAARSTAWFDTVIATLARTITPADSWEAMAPTDPAQEAMLLLGLATTQQELAAQCDAALQQQQQQKGQAPSEAEQLSGSGGAEHWDALAWLLGRAEVAQLVQRCVVLKREIERHRRFAQVQRTQLRSALGGGSCDDLRDGLDALPHRIDGEGGAVSSGSSSANSHSRLRPAASTGLEENAAAATAHATQRAVVQSVCAALNDPLHTIGARIHRFTQRILATSGAAAASPSQLRRAATSHHLRSPASPTTSHPSSAGDPIEFSRLVGLLPDFVETILLWLRHDSTQVVQLMGSSHPHGDYLSSVASMSDLGGEGPPHEAQSIAASLLRRGSAEGRDGSGASGVQLGFALFARAESFPDDLGGDDAATAGTIRQRHWKLRRSVAYAAAPSPRGGNGAASNAPPPPLLEGLSDTLLVAAIEDAVYASVYPAVFDLCSDRDGDATVARQCRRARGLPQEALQVPPEFRGAGFAPYLSAVTILRSVGQCRTPTRKVAAVREAAIALLEEMQRNAATAANSHRRSRPGESPPPPPPLPSPGAAPAPSAAPTPALGSDDFVPVFVFALLQADIATLASEVAFITNGMPDSLKNEELGYFATTLELCVEYIKTMRFTTEKEVQEEGPARGSSSTTTSSCCPGAAAHASDAGAGAGSVDHDGAGAPQPQTPSLTAAAASRAAMPPLFALLQPSLALQWAAASCGAIEVAGGDALVTAVNGEPAHHFTPALVDAFVLDPLHPIKALLTRRQQRQCEPAGETEAEPVEPSSELRVAIVRVAAGASDAHREAVGRLFLIPGSGAAIPGLEAATLALRDCTAVTLLVSDEVAFSNYVQAGAVAFQRGGGSAEAAGALGHALLAAHLSGTLLRLAQVAPSFAGAPPSCEGEEQQGGKGASLQLMPLVLGSSVDAAVAHHNAAALRAAWPLALRQPAVLLGSDDGDCAPRLLRIFAACLRHPLWTTPTAAPPGVAGTIPTDAEDAVRLTTLTQYLLFLFGFLPSQRFVTGVADSVTLRALRLATATDTPAAPAARALRRLAQLQARRNPGAATLWDAFLRPAVRALATLLDALGRASAKRDGAPDAATSGASSDAARSERARDSFASLVIATGPIGVSSRIAALQQQSGLIADGRCVAAATCELLLEGGDG